MNTQEAEGVKYPNSVAESLKSASPEFSETFLAGLSSQLLAYGLKKKLLKNEPEYFRFAQIISSLFLISRCPTWKRLLRWDTRALIEQVETLPKLAERVDAFLCTYSLGRTIDDLSDDPKNKARSVSICDELEHLVQKLEEENFDANTQPEKFLRHIMIRAANAGVYEEIRRGFAMVLLSIQYDAERIDRFQKTGRYEFRSAHELDYNYYRLDSLGVGCMMMAYLDEDKLAVSFETIRRSVDLTEAVRRWYSIRDMKSEDLLVGINNIPQEEASMFGITQEVLEQYRDGDVDIADFPPDTSSIPDPLMQWFWYQAEQMNYLLQEAEPLLGGEYKDLTRFVLKSAYWKPCSRFAKGLSGVCGVLWDKKPESFDSSQKCPNPMKYALTRARDLANRYLSDLEIEPNQLSRYYSKCRNLSLMYLGFTSDHTYRTAYGAWLSAFLSVAYDVCSDWMQDKEAGYIIFRKILTSETNAYTTQMVLDMFCQDISGWLKNGWLDRGYISFVFILEEMGVLDRYDETQLREAGQSLQVIDDVLDYEDDQRYGDQNFLIDLSRDRREYFSRLACNTFSRESLSKLFPGNYAFLLRSVIKKGCRKLEKGGWE